MRIACIVRSYHNTDFLADVLKQFDWIDKVLVVNTLHLNYEDAPDDTEEIVKKLGQSNVEILKLPSELEHTILNQAISHLQEYDRIFICDADEFMDRKDWERILELDWHDSGTVRMVDVMPDGTEVRRNHIPVMVVKPDVMFNFQRCAPTNFKWFEDVTMKHYGYCVKDLDWKKRNYTKLNMDEPIK